MNEWFIQNAPLLSSRNKISHKFRVTECKNFLNIECREIIFYFQFSKFCFAAMKMSSLFTLCQGKSQLQPVSHALFLLKYIIRSILSLVVAFISCSSSWVPPQKAQVRFCFYRILRHLSSLLILYVCLSCVKIEDNLESMASFIV